VGKTSPVDVPLVPNPPTASIPMRYVNSLYYFSPLPLSTSSSNTRRQHLLQLDCVSFC